MHTWYCPRTWTSSAPSYAVLLKLDKCWPQFPQQTQTPMWGRSLTTPSKIGKGAVRGSIVDLWACNYSCRVNALRNVITLRATFARSPGRVCVVRTSKSLKWDVTPTGKRSACVLLYRAMHLRRDVFITPNQLRRMRAQWWMPKLDWVHFLQVKSWTGSTQIGFGTLLVWWVCFFSCQIHFWK